MDNGQGGDFFSIYNTSVFTTYIVSSGIVRGWTYRFRYRVQNINAWSPFSPIGYISAFSTPSTPPAPQFVSATGTSVTLNLFYSADDNGALVQAYELWIDAGNNLQS